VEPNIESLDWTRELLSEREIERFANRVIWPAIDNLHRKYRVGKYFSYQNLGEEFSLEECLGTPLGEQLMVVSMEADCDLDVSDADISGSVTFMIEERLTEDEGYLIPEDSDLQIWRRTTLHFDKSSPGSVCVDCYPCLTNPRHDEVENLDDEKKSMLAFLGESTLENLTWQDCLDVMNILFALGVPESALNKLMRRYDRRR
jgi:hypothetical protein